MQLPPPPSARRHLQVGGRAAGSPPSPSIAWFPCGRRASEPNVPSREVSVRLNIAACHDRRLFVASEKGINDTPARDSVFLSLFLSLSLSLLFARANTEYITMNYLRDWPDARFSNAELFLSFTSKSARGDALFRRECAGCESTNCTKRSSLVTAELLNLFHTSRFLRHPCERSRLFVCISETFCHTHAIVMFVEKRLPAKWVFKNTNVAYASSETEFRYTSFLDGSLHLKIQQRVIREKIFTLSKYPWNDTRVFHIQTWKLIISYFLFYVIHRTDFWILRFYRC